MERESERGKEKNDRISALQKTFIDHLRWLSLGGKLAGLDPGCGLGSGLWYQKFPVSALINYYKLIGFKHCKCIIL